MNLTKTLRKAGYDLIDGPIRNHKILQLWRKKSMNKIGTYYNHITDAIKSDEPLNIVESKALNVNSTTKNEYKFNIGISVLESVLESLGMGEMNLSAKIKTGKKVSISYDHSFTREVPIGEVDQYLFNSDLASVNPPLLKNLNRDNVIAITGVLLAKNLIVQIETDFDIDSDLVASLNSSIKGKLAFSASSKNSLSMKSSGDAPFPIAVKAYRIDYDKGEFKKTKIITDNRSFF